MTKEILDFEGDDDNFSKSLSDYLGSKFRLLESSFQKVINRL